MSDRFDHGPVQTYEVTWRTGHIERILAHQISWPKNGVSMLASMFGAQSEQVGASRIHFHAEIDGRWTLTLAADEDDILSIRLVTADEPLPETAGGVS